MSKLTVLEFYSQLLERDAAAVLTHIWPIGISWNPYDIVLCIRYFNKWGDKPYFYADTGNRRDHPPAYYIEDYGQRMYQLALLHGLEVVEE